MNAKPKDVQKRYDRAKREGYNTPRGAKYTIVMSRGGAKNPKREPSLPKFSWDK